MRFWRALHVAGDTFAAQIAAFCASAWASGTMFWRWRRMDAVGLRRVWALYGWFSGLMLCGSCFGAVTWGVWMQREVDYFSSVSSNLSTSVASESALVYFYKSKSERLSSVYIVNHAIEFF